MHRSLQHLTNPLTFQWERRLREGKTLFARMHASAAIVVTARRPCHVCHRSNAESAEFRVRTLRKKTLLCTEQEYGLKIRYNYTTGNKVSFLVINIIILAR